MVTASITTGSLPEVGKAIVFFAGFESSLLLTTIIIFFLKKSSAASDRISFLKLQKNKTLRPCLHDKGSAFEPYCLGFETIKRKPVPFFEVIQKIRNYVSLSRLYRGLRSVVERSGIRLNQRL